MRWFDAHKSMSHKVIYINVNVECHKALGPVSHRRYIFFLFLYLRLLSAFDTLLADSAAHTLSIKNPTNQTNKQKINK